MSWLLVACLWLLSACSADDSTEERSEPLPTSSETRTTGRTMDVGIEGDGLFVMQRPESSQRTFSRLGHLDLDAEGRLVHSDGGWVMGVPDAGAADAQPLALMPLRMLPKASSLSELEANLPALTPARSAESTFDPQDSDTFDYALSFSCWGEDGREVYVTLFFVHRDVDQWLVHARINREWVDAPSVVQFHPDDPQGSTSSSTMNLRASASGLSQTMEVRLRLTQHNSPFSASVQTDGYPAGELRTVRVSTEGKVQLEYDNAQSTEGGQLQLARFTVADRLVREGSSSWKCSRDCGAPLFGAPGSPLMGTTRSGTLNTAY